MILYRWDKSCGVNVGIIINGDVKVNQKIGEKSSGENVFVMTRKISERNKKTWNNFAACL